MRILEVGKFYPPVRGGMETVLATLCRGLARRGHTLRALVAHDAWPGRRETIDGIEVQRLGSWGMLRSVSLTPALLWQFRANLRAFQPDVVHLHLPHPAAGLAWLAARTDVPLVLSYHSDIVRQRWLARLWEPGRRRLLDRARTIVVSSDALADGSPTLARHRGKCSTVAFGIDPEDFNDSTGERAQEMRLRHGRYFLFVGRLVYYKGFEVLIDAMEYESFSLLVAGSGPLRRKWEDAAVRRGLAGRLRFLGDCDDAELRQLIQGCVALVLPSTLPSESFGIVQIEAMAAARPVIAARASRGVESVQVDGETGFLVPPRDAGALRAAMRQLWDDDALAQRLGRAARRRLDERYTAERMVDEIETLLRACVETSRPR
ncbi:MAG TPA: glycosyltransferase [Candidatus Krumholzibacteria bacterium]